MTAGGYSISVPDPHTARADMVRSQIEARGVRDPAVLAAMRTVPRHEFVPGDVRGRAYTDSPLPLGHGQTISQPYIVAHMTELLGLEGGERVLEIGTGSGYQAAVLAELARRVFTVEIVEPLLRRAAATLARLAYRNVICRLGDGGFGWKDLAPFDAILLSAAPPTRVPPALLEQLAVGGRLVAPVGRLDQRLVIVTRTPESFQFRKATPVRFVPLVGDAV